ncbi:MAG: FUSC family protein, partial [Gramella sp.]|nr:FUSC family protein [Christiangramia sp.]
VIAGSIKANLDYLREIDEYYHEKKSIPVAYKLARKKAFLEMGELSGAFQRMTQEPKSRQKQLGLVYEIVGLNHTFLSALASLGTYIRNHPTTSASKDFEIYTKGISVNLDNCLNILQSRELVKNKKEEISNAAKALHDKFDKLAEQRDLEIKAGKDQIDISMRFKLQEAHLVTKQLEWLLDISEKLKVNTGKLKID